VKVLVASAHLRTSRGKLWRDLQWKFLSENADVDFDYAVVANGTSPQLYENAKFVLPMTDATHLACIREILGLFREHERYTHLLLLDSDAWPVRPWFEILDSLLARFDNVYAAPMRAENYDDFPHPSAVLMARNVVEWADFGGSNKYYNLLGQSVNDVGCGMDQGKRSGRLWLPLMKTNMWSPHPLFASIYGDLFYHHGAGSREPGIRLAGLGVYDHILKRQDHRKIYNRVTRELKRDPDGFIGRLRGLDGFQNS